MIDEQEKQEIIARAVEKALLALPDVVGNLFVSRAAMAKLTSGFYRDHPEFAASKEAVVSVLEMVEGRYPGMKYEDLLAKAVPEIRERIAVVKELNTTTLSKTPDRHLPPLKDVEFPHGEI